MANKNPDMSGLKHFPPGKSGNPGGKTAAHRQAEVEAAQIAAQIQLNMVKALAGAVEADSEGALESIRSDVLRLIKDAQDRGFGAPVAPVDLTSTDGTMSPGLNVTSLSDAALQEIMNARAKPE